MKNKILISGIIGMLGTVLMYMGDMFLYYTPTPFVFTEQVLFEIMGKVSKERLMIGGLLGPLCAIMYSIGYYQIYLAVSMINKRASMAICGLLISSIIFGGAFHSHFTYLGMIASHNNDSLLADAQQYLIITLAITLLLNSIGYLVLAYYVIFKKTAYPKWIILCSPLVLILISNSLHDLPYPFNLFISGGWSNIAAFIFFMVSTITLLKYEKKISKPI